MTLTAGTNCFTQAEDSLISLLAKSAAVRTFLGVSTESEARNRIYIDEVPGTTKADGDDDWDEESYAALYPCAIIHSPEDGFFEVKQDSRDGVINYLIDWKFVVSFSRFANQALDEQNQWREFKNLLFDGLVEMLETTSAEPDVFLASNITPDSTISISDFRDRRDLGTIIEMKLLFTRVIQ